MTLVHYTVIFVLLPLFSSCADVCTRDERVEEMDRCFIMIKPDGVQRGLVGQIISRFESKGFKMVAMKMIKAEENIIQDHYAEHAGKKFFADLVDYMKSGPVVPMVWEGNNIVQIARTMLGATDPINSLPGTIRGDLAVSKQMNLCHVSDSNDSASREISLWFDKGELISWKQTTSLWTFKN